MSYSVITRWGHSVDRPTSERMLEILNELDAEDQEHPDCWLTHHESGWSLSAFEGGLVVFENAESDTDPRHLLDVPRAKALEMWQTLANGDLTTVENEPWRPGYGPPMSTAELEAHRKTVESWQLEHDRTFYDSLLPEEPGTQCQREGCQKGASRFSLFCRAHHFENIQGKLCPFAD
jgi:hypothetical protein